MITLEEYTLRSEANSLRKLDELFVVMQGAWASRSVTATGEDGKYVLQDFVELFDFEEAEARILRKPSEKAVRKVSELEERSRRVKAAEALARQRLEERRKLDGTK